jgi:lysophospholipase L1-like esterase
VLTRRRAACLLSVVSLVLGACSHDKPKVTKPATVLIVGDSLLYQSAGPLAAVLRERGWVPVFDARPGSAILGGFSIGSWPPRIGQLVRATNPDVVVVELGTNGCGHCRSMAAGIDADMKELRAVPRVYWVNVKESSPIPPHPKAVNDALDAAKKRWKNLRIIDMNKAFARHPDLLLSDHIHFDDKGVAEFVKLVADKLPRQN